MWDCHAQISNNNVKLANQLVNYQGLSKLVVIVSCLLFIKKDQVALTLHPTPPTQQESGHPNSVN